ncbi:MAG: hypothetical protein QNK04_10630 [Myxococcota bacterium]|nr:hypothetical protein [Myxococcota bacterium]
MHRQTLAFSLGSLIAVLTGTMLAVSDSSVGRDAREWLADLAPGSEREPVLVIVLQDRPSVWSVLAAVKGERILAASPEAFALRDRRVVSASFEAVGPLLMLAGWRDEPIEIIAAGRGPEPTPPPVDRVAALVNKPRLTLLESRALLSQM